MFEPAFTLDLLWLHIVLSSMREGRDEGTLFSDVSYNLIPY